MSPTLLKSADIALRPEALRRDAETLEARRAEAPLPFSIVRLLLIAAPIAGAWALGGELTWAWVALGLAACLGLFLWAVGSVQQRVLDLVWSPLCLPLGIFFLLGVAQYATRLTLDTSETRQALVLLATDLVFFFLAVQLFDGAGRESWRAIGLTVLTFSGALGLFAILQFASEARQIYWRFDTNGSLFGPYSNPDHYAGLMEMVIPVAVLYIVERQRRISGAALALLLVAVGVAAASLLLSGSRAGLIALTVEAVIASILLARRSRKIRRWRLAATAAATTLGVLLLFSWVDSGWVAKRLLSVAHIGSPSRVDEGRKSLALDSLRMWGHHPILGVGLGNFETAYPGYQSFPSDLWIDHAHNDYLEAIAETGLVGAILIVSALVIFFRLAFSKIGRQLESEGGWIRLGAALGCCGMLVHSLFDYNLHIPANAAWFAVLAGMATVRGGEVLNLPGPNSGKGADL